MAPKKPENGFANRGVAPAKRSAFPEIATESLRDKVVASLKDAFFSGHLKPGDAIVERHLAQQMKVGSPAVREALITLQEQGFVHRVANTATYVNSFTMDEVRHLYQLRIEFELLAFKWAKLHVKEADIKVLERLVDAMVSAAVHEDRRTFFEHDLEFHRYCWRLSGNKFLERSLENLVPPLFAFVLNASDYHNIQEPVAKQHLQIISALKSAFEPEFSAIIRESLGTFALEGVSSIVEGHHHRS
jgi:DNA-binding GntR family transcriptional regulator